MSVYKRPGSPYFTMDFVIGSKRIHESTKARTKTLAQQVERNRRRELEQALTGVPVEQRDKRLRSVADAIKAYTDAFGVNHRDKTTVNVKGRLAHVKRLMGTALTPDLTERNVKDYIAARLKEGASGRTINMEVAELSRAVGKPWRQLWPKLKKLDERTDVGKALSPAEEERLLSVVGSTQSQLGQTFVRVALLTGMRYSEILGLTWDRVDLGRRVVTVGKSKTAAGSGRQIPMNDGLHAILSTHADWYVDKFRE